MPADLAQFVVDLKDADPGKRAHAAEALARLGPQASPAAVALVQACGDDSEEV